MVWARLSGPSSSGSRPPNARCRWVLLAAAARGGGHRVRRPRRERGHHPLGARQPWRARDLARQGQHPVARRLVAVQHIVGAQHPGRHQQPGRAQQRVPAEVGGQLGGVPVGGLDVGARVAAQPDHRQVQEGGLAAVAHPGRRGQRGVVDLREVSAVRVEVPDAGPAGLRGRDPAGRRPHADAQAVVLADQQQRHRQPLIGAVSGRVERSGGARVVDRRVAEAAGHDGVLRPGRGRSQLGRAGQREGQADRARQVRRDGGGLRDDVQGRVAEHLVPAARDRFGGRGHQAEQHMPDAVGRRAGLTGPDQVESPGAVMQQRRVGQPQGRGHARVALVAR